MSHERLPIFERGLRVALVERVGMPGKLGVCTPGGVVCPLPDGYDGKTSVNVDAKGWVLVTHPVLPPLLADTTKGEVHPIDADLVDPKLFTGPKLITSGSTH